MSFISNIAFRDSGNIDAFARLRVSNPIGLFNSQHQYDISPLIWDTVLVGTGAVSHVANQSAARLTTGGTADLASAIFRSREHVRYQPGKSQLVEATFAMGTHYTNCIMEAGYFDDENGIFFRRAGDGTLQMVRRTYTSGSVVEEVVDQSSWSDDTMDGSGPSGVTLDSTKAQIFFMDLEWLGVGRVRVGFFYNGLPIYVHQFNHANILSNVYMTTANLPISYRVYNDGVATGTGVFDAICSAVISEGGFEADRSYQHTRTRLSTISAPVGGACVLGVRPRQTFQGVTNRGQIKLEEVVVAQTSSGISRWSLFYNPTFAGGSWVNIDTTNSIAEYNEGATVTGGVEIHSGLLVGTVQNDDSVQAEISSKLPIVIGADGTSQYGVALVVYAYAGTETVSGGMNWKEFR